VATLRRMHDTLTAQDKQPIYLIHNGYHYNPIKYERATPIHTNSNMPTWAQNPPTTQRQKRKRKVVSLDDSDSDNSDTDSEDTNKEEECRSIQHQQKKIKTDHKTKRMQENKRKKSTDELITPEHRYKTQKATHAGKIAKTD